ncbi:glycosyltransferase [Haliea sp. E17]|uniref:glycosyltransferase n=1 Tax=Haliea sp. E17 TaxID=3401576 RepID=UPI003AAF6B2E
MIFVTVGTQLPFDRMVAMVDEYCDAHAGLEVFAQVGNGARYIPRNFESVGMLSLAESRRCFEQSDVIISHVGIGSILTALGLGKPILMMARLAELQEHRDNHQEQTLRHFQAFQQCFPFATPDELEDALARTLRAPQDLPPLSPYAPENMLMEIRRLLN